MNTFNLGDMVTISVAITNAAGTATDPTTLRFYFRRSDATPATATKGGSTNPYVYGVDGAMVKDSTGNYHINLGTAVPGLWKYRWTSLDGSAEPSGATTGEFYVEPNPIP